MNGTKNSAKRFISSISFRISLLSVCAFAIVSFGVVWMVFSFARSEALREAEEKAFMVLNRNLASHQYFDNQIKQSLPKSDNADSCWMSSGYYAVRDINKLEHVLSGKEGYYYKECAINARNHLNEADNIEKQFLVELNMDRQLKVQSGVKNFDGKPYFYILRRGDSMEDACIRCHSTPERAPGTLVEQYGSERSFNRNVGEALSALSIRIPLEHAYVEANKLALRLSIVVVISFACMFLLLYMLLRRDIFNPLSLMRQKTEDICENEQNLGTDIPALYGTELNDLIVTFNTMSRRVKDQMDKLEERVKERTSELEKALEKVSTLHGMLPICSSCKKIRDDKGYWSQVETYISEHSEAVFTSGICPECEKTMYAKLDQLKNENLS
jgi:hypothetical protein